jgi:hypothetical protein
MPPNQTKHLAACLYPPVIIDPGFEENNLATTGGPDSSNTDGYPGKKRDYDLKC